MLTQFRVLSAMLAVREFTVPDLAKLADVNEASAHTVRRRHAGLLEEAGTEQTGRRGGQPKKYRLTEAGEQEVTALLHRLYAELPAPPSRAAGVGESPDVAYRSALAVAEHALLARVAQPEEPEDVEDGLRVARAALKGADRALERLPAHGRHPQDRRVLDHHKRLGFVVDLLDAGHLEPGDVPRSVGARLADLVKTEPEDPGDVRVLLYRCAGPERSWFGSGLDDPEKSLLRRVAHLLRAAGAQPVLTGGAEEATARFTRGDGAVIVLVNTANAASLAECRGFVELADQRVCVLDLASSAYLQNQVLKRNGWYIPHAAELEENALLAAFARLRFVRPGFRPVLPVPQAAPLARPEAAEAPRAALEVELP